MSTTLWGILGYTLNLLLCGVAFYVVKAKQRRVIKEILEQHALDVLKATLKGQPGICGRCGLRPVEADGSMCTWCGI